MKKKKIWWKCLLGLTPLTIIAPIAASCSNIQKQNNYNLEKFEYDDYVIPASSTYVDANVDYSQTDKDFNTYFSEYNQLESVIQNQNENFYKYHLIKNGSIADYMKRVISLNDPEVADWYQRLTLNGIKKDIAAYINKIYSQYNTLIKDDFSFSASDIKISATRLNLNQETIIINPNQKLIRFDPDISVNDLNQDIKINLDFSITLTNQSKRDIIIKDLFSTNAQAIRKNSSLTINFAVKDSPLILDLYRDQKYKTLSNFESQLLHNTYKLGYYFNAINITSESKEVRENAKQGEENLFIISPGPINLVWNRAMGRVLWDSYVLNQSLKNVTYKQNIFNMNNDLLTKLKTIKGNDILEDIKHNFESGQLVVKTTVNNVFDILNSVYEDQNLVTLFKTNANAFYDLLLNYTRSKAIAKIAQTFASNRSFGEVLETFKPVLGYILDILLKDKKSIKKIIYEKFMSINFAQNLINEADQLQALIASIDLAPIVPFKRLINAVFQEVINSEKKAKTDNDGTYGIFNFFDDIASLLLSIPTNDLPELNIGEDLTLASLVNEIKEIIDLIVPKQNDSLGAEQKYLFSQIKVLDLISLNQDETINYKEGLIKIIDLLKTFKIMIPENILEILNTFIFKNGNWSKANIQKLLRSFLYLETTTNNETTTISLKDFINNQIAISFDEQTLEFEYDDEKQTINKLQMFYTYTIKQNVGFNLQNIYDLLPSSDDNQQINKIISIVRNELPKRLELIAGDYLEHKVVINEPQQITPMIYRAKENDQYALGYTFYPQHTVNVHFTETIKKLLDQSQYTANTILSKDYLAPVLSLLFYRQWTFKQPFSIFATNSISPLNKINEQYKDEWSKFNQNAYHTDYTFIYDPTKWKALATNNISVLDNLFNEIETKSIDKITLTDALNRRTSIYQTNDVLNVDLEELIKNKVFAFGKGIDLDNDVYITALPVVLGIPKTTENESDELLYQNVLMKKILLVIHFKKPVVDLSNPNQPLLVWTKRIFI
ncbi:hypothetical protein OF377_00900 [Ureaplasma sp. ES3154-GEN]|uniref:hypothetical protein n=1 Tax=Ureaplasma sp. ES3154-GEN TaxID=2984844 RepID=UPI0021E8A21F|nr:hypothetical protein [Ureaplasma sp. ES3154-GEN]MCV3743446.1 hypothetical protein [Ureaplasma sp. ES3154-GEN]